MPRESPTGDGGNRHGQGMLGEAAGLGRPVNALPNSAFPFRTAELRKQELSFMETDRTRGFSREIAEP